MRRLAIPLLATCLLSTVARADDALVPTVHKPRVEIVFALDTTGSMGGLIDGAKRKIWSIANEVQKAQQKPEVRIGLVAFRDHGDQYVTQVTPLTSDLDKIYGALMQLRADGGGDTPEDVNGALDAALTQMQWSDDKSTLKMVFLVGDAPPHMDYQEKTWPQIAHAAVRRDIYINTVQCGGDPETTASWKSIAHAAEGRYAAIPQDGGVSVAMATPYDDELKRLSTALDGTYLEYGRREVRDEKAKTRATAEGYAMHAAPPAVAADRAVAKAAAAPKVDEDIVDLAAARGGARAALGAVSEEALPDELRGKDAAEQQKIVAEKLEQRERITKKIAELSKKRDAALADARKKAPAKGDAFDDQIVETIHKEAAASKVLTY